ncbi:MULTISPECIES: c-type cytochrome [Methylobacterium]|uniref:c-type cytochrome n=1 Tax=Methylobacterium TaxID=407 RepID=UPI00104DF75C|nr:MULTISPECIES: cytochrome c family protein [Methylobacterium]MDR7036399.1 cytochrome c [Methylobacterium sp. BE186]
MDSFEVNKVAGAVLGALLFAMGSGFVAELIYHPKPAGSAGYELPEPKAEAGGAPAAKAEPVSVRLASANVEKGQAGTKACQSCHSFEKGGPNKVGPHLWDVVERQKAHEPGFDYSASLKEKGGAWTYEDLDHFLESPKGYAKGTKMAFAGISSPQERANVIAYLRTLSDSPKPLPAAEKADAKSGEAKSGEAKPADAKPADAKPESKPADAAPTKAGGDKPSAETPAANKPSEGKDSPAKPADTKEAKPVGPKPAGSVEGHNEVAPQQAPEAGGPAPSAKDAPAPAAPSAPDATEAPAKPDPAAEQKAKDLDAGSKPAQQ